MVVNQTLSQVFSTIKILRGTAILMICKYDPLEQWCFVDHQKECLPFIRKALKDMKSNDTHQNIYIENSNGAICIPNTISLKR